MAKRRNHAPAFKAKVALAALSGNKTIAELSKGKIKIIIFHFLYYRTLLLILLL